MNTVTLELPLDALAAPGVPPEERAREALCGIGRVEFLLAAGRAGVPLAALDGDELDGGVRRE